MIKTTTNHRLLIMAAIMLAGVLAASSAQAALEGTFDGTISEKLKATGCGKDKDVIAASTTLNLSKTWMVLSNEGTYEGTYKAKSGGRKLFLTFDSNSKALFKESMRDWASDICETTVKKLKQFKYKIKLKLNKKRTVLSGTIVGKAIGKTRDGSGKGTYTGKVKMFVR